MHDASHSPFGAWVYGSAEAIEECGTGADEDETGILLLWGWDDAVLFYEVVQGEFGGV